MKKVKKIFMLLLLVVVTLVSFRQPVSAALCKHETLLEVREPIKVNDCITNIWSKWVCVNPSCRQETDPRIIQTVGSHSFGSWAEYDRIVTGGGTIVFERRICRICSSQEVRTYRY